VLLDAGPVDAVPELLDPKGAGEAKKLARVGVDAMLGDAEPALPANANLVLGTGKRDTPGAINEDDTAEAEAETEIDEDACCCSFCKRACASEYC